MPTATNEDATEGAKRTFRSFLEAEARKIILAVLDKVLPKKIASVEDWIRNNIKKDVEERNRVTREATANARAALKEAEQIRTALKPGLEQLNVAEDVRGHLVTANETLQATLAQINAAATTLNAKIKQANELDEKFETRKQEFVELNREFEIAQQVLKGLKKQQEIARPSGNGAAFWIILIIVLTATGAGLVWLFTGPLSNLLSEKSASHTPIQALSALPTPLPPPSETSQPPPAPPAQAKKTVTRPLMSSTEPNPDEHVPDASTAPPPENHHADKINSLREYTYGSGPNGDMAPFTRTVKGRTYTCQDKEDPDPTSTALVLRNCDWVAAPITPKPQPSPSHFLNRTFP